MLANIRTRLWAHPHYRRWLLLNCLIGLFSTSYTNTILAVSLKEVARDLDSTPSVIAWVLTAPSLAGAVAIPVLGRLGDIRGHRTLFLVGFALNIVFTALTALAPSAAWLIGFRTAAQVAGSAIVPSSFAILFRTFPPEQRVKAASWASAVLSGSSVAGLVIGGPVVDRWGWQPLFVMQTIVALAAFVLALFVLQPDAERRQIGIDIPGALLLGATIFALTFSVNRLTAVGPSPLALVLLALAPVLAVALVRLERRVTDPILPLALVTNRAVRTVSLTALFVGAGWTGTFVLTPLLLRSVFGYSTSAASYLTILRTLAITGAAPIAGRLGVRYGERRVLQLATLGLIGATATLAVGATTSTLFLVLAGLVLTGWAFGHVQPGMSATIANSVDQTDFGLATSLQQMSNSIGFVFGLGLITAIAADSEDPHTYGVAFGIAALFMIAAALTVRLLGSSPVVASPAATATPAT